VPQKNTWSNKYAGFVERGTSPLDHRAVIALAQFVKDNFPSHSGSASFNHNPWPKGLFRKRSAFLFNIWQHLSLECPKKRLFAINLGSSRGVPFAH
jgi:hypothetical protein